MVASTFLSVLLALLLQSIYAVDHHTDFYGHVIEPQAVSRLEYRNCVPFSWTKKLTKALSVDPLVFVAAFSWYLETPTHLTSACSFAIC